MSAVKSQPIFLDAAGNPIFTLQYPAAGQARDIIIICAPAPQEVMRAQASLGQLARRLQTFGCHTVRFDYSGTGDSAGGADSISLDQWLTDLLAVCEHARRESPNARLSLIGLRLGAALAVRASRLLTVDRLVLWDPVLDGIYYIREMEASHARMFDRYGINPPFGSSNYDTEQCWGFPWSASWRSQLAAVSPSMLTPSAQSIHVIQSATDPIVRDCCQSWEQQGIAVDLQFVGEPLHWGDEGHIKIRAFPSAHLRRIQALWETPE